MTIARPSVRWTSTPRVRRLHDGVMGGECGECGNITAPLTFRQGRWCCVFCLTTDLLVADLGKPTGPKWVDHVLAATALALWITLIFSHLP